MDANITCRRLGKVLPDEDVAGGMSFDDRDGVEEALADSGIAWGWQDHRPPSPFDVEVVQTERPNLADLVWVIAALESILGLEERLALTFRQADDRQATYDLEGQAPDLVRAAHDDYEAGASGLRAWNSALARWTHVDPPSQAGDEV